MSVPRYESFGRTNPPAARAVHAPWAIALLEGGKAGEGSLLAYGNGRSYGDSCQNSLGAVIDMRSMNRIISFDPETGILEAEAGVLLTDIIAHAAPYGFFPYVVPGTQYVTLGGAIANDVHGKNHHRRGTFGCHVVGFSLLRSDGSVHRCTRDAESALFAATIGGMGMTGLMLAASIRLMPVTSLDIAERVMPFQNLQEFVDQAEVADAENEYAVAWIDQLATGLHAGRGLLLTGNHADAGDARHRTTRLGVPFQPPINILNRPFLKTFNAAYRWSKGRTREKTSDYGGFFFPLDGVRDWNRLYGPRGLYQHQSVVPEDAARVTLPLLLDAAIAAGQGSFLTVLKRFGAVRSPGLLSFPRPGYTLTLDFPNRGTSTIKLLERLDAITLDAGGAINPYKDARLGAQAFAASFPNWRELEALRDPVFISDFWRRTALQLNGYADQAAAAAG
ncbi:FAD-binding protein [Mesorhizobium sp. NBSH29]|uniref:FAD-binding oxidoreductase n=1 Tax=Mesorhizobium sp. NBSH29 TaxID=2654249 RepID=UPI00189650B5|nr:FAD-binding oxidoreductase [Mesorhizobium sp. NBSH29]QPC88116.1 FAD-binding protein [Mesorhizobium sp. NBSH29]